MVEKGRLGTSITALYKLFSQAKEKLPIFDLVIIGIATVLFLHWEFGITIVGGADFPMHLSRVRILKDNLPHIVRWNSWWYFGTPMLRFYSPLMHYAMATIAWFFGLSLADAYRVLTYLVFTLCALSTYLLAGELGLERAGRYASVALFLTSFNMYAWWVLGSFPHIMAFALSLLSLLLFLAAARKPKLIRVLAFGVSLSLVMLTHPYSVAVLSVLLLALVVALSFLKPELIAISRGSRLPPIYTLILPKVLLGGLVIALLFSAWSWVPGVLESPYTVIPAKSPLAIPSPIGSVSVFDQIANIVGVGQSAYFTPGVEHVFLGLIGVVLIVARGRYRGQYALIPILLAVSFLGAMARYVPVIPIALPNRFGPYLSLFWAIAGAFTVTYAASEYRFVVRNKIVLASLCIAVLGITFFPFAQGLLGRGGRGIPFSKPESYTWVERHINPGERLVGYEYYVNMYTDVPQAHGGYSWGIANEFAYTYWYYQIRGETGDARLLPYFSRNFNVRYFIGGYGSAMAGRAEAVGMSEALREVHGGVYEVKDFSSSLVEVIDSETLVLFVGEDYEYSNMFVATALTNPNIVLARVEYLEDLDSATIDRFDAIYLAGLRYRNYDTFTELIRDYAKNGGGVILDTGGITYGGGAANIPDPFPIASTVIRDSRYKLTQSTPSEILEGVDLESFLTDQKFSLSFALDVKDGAEIIVNDEDRPVIVSWSYEQGRVVWTGMRPPYRTTLDLLEDGSKLLVNLIDCVASAPKVGSAAFTTFELPEPERIDVHVSGASANDALWVKMSYYPGWRAYVNGHEQQVFLAGPNMMLILPGLEGDYAVTFIFGESWAEILGRVLTVVGIAFFASLVVLPILKRRWFGSSESKVKQT